MSYCHADAPSGLSARRLAECGFVSVWVSKQKLGVEMPRTRIIGTNKPEVGYKLLRFDYRIGSLLPFSRIVRELPSGATEVAMVDPVELFAPIGAPEVSAVASEVREVFRNVLNGLQPVGGGDA